MYIDGTYYHPTFLYESLWNILGFTLLIVARRIVFLKKGELFLVYIMWYSFGRFFIEGLRTDSLMLTTNLRVAQVISLIFFISAVLLIWYRRRKAYKSGIM